MKYATMSRDRRKLDEYDERTRKNIMGGTQAVPSGEFDEYGLSLSTAAAREYALLAVSRANVAAANSFSVTSILDPDIGRLNDSDFIATVQLGIPSRARRDIWLKSSGAELRMIKGRSEFRILSQRLKRQKDFAVPGSVLEQIEKDITRTLGQNEIRDRETLKKRIRRVLILHSMQKPIDGYAQSLNYFAMSFLIVGMTEEEAFWMLHHVTENLFPYSFDANMSGYIADMETFKYYFKRLFPALAEQYEPCGFQLCPPSAFASLLCGMMPYESVWCVWDRMFAAGAHELFIAVFKLMTHAESLMKKIEITTTQLDPSPRRRGLGSVWRRQSLADSPPPLIMEAKRVYRYEHEFDAAVLHFAHTIQAVVNIPDLLARTKLSKRIDIGALTMRRNRHREIAHADFHKKSDIGPSESSDSSDSSSFPD